VRHLLNVEIRVVWGGYWSLKVIGNVAIP